MIATNPPYGKYSHKLKCIIPESPFKQLHSATLAVDTEFCGTHTLTVQVATRLDSGRLAVQIYNNPSIPPLPATLNLEKFVPFTSDAYGRFCKHIILRPAKQLTSNLSPTHLMQHVTGQGELEILPLVEAEKLVKRIAQGSAPTPQGTQRKGNGRLAIPELDLTLVGHFLAADFCRVFGRDFWEGLKEWNRAQENGIVVRSRRLLQFVDESNDKRNPVLEFFFRESFLYATRVHTRDTMLPFGPASLDAQSRLFLGLGKSNSLSSKDKKDMFRTFYDKTEEAYGYAIVDAVNTLLIHEEMERRDRAIYQRFGIHDDEIPQLRPTLGGRVSTFLMRTTKNGTALGSEQLIGSQRALTALMEKGGIEVFNNPSISRYGTQTGKVHGGLLYSRSPKKFWHEASGMLRDVDMAGCYEKVISGMSVYWGRPVIFEPGAAVMSLREAVEMVRRNADDDGWLIRVTGPITAAPNALIPSTDNAITSANYRQKLRKGKRRQHQRAFHLEALRDPIIS